MYKVFGFFILLCVACHAVPASLPVSSQLSCEKIPDLLWSCINMPHETEAPEIQNKCRRPGFMTCEELTCRFREQGWMNGAAVNKTALSADLGKISSDSGLDWTDALEKAKTICLELNLLVNIYSIDCPTYDVAFCITAALIKHAPSATWPTAHYCAPSRLYAESCPMCPECVARSLHALPR